jgi:predicted HTH transcriptional regulator
MKCSRCGGEILDDEGHPYQGKILCDECYAEVISTEKTCDPWATFLSGKTRERAGQKGEEGLSPIEKKIYEFIRNQGRTTRGEVMTKLGISMDDLAPQLNVLMHAKLITEHGEGDQMYLVPVPATEGID